MFSSHLGYLYRRDLIGYVTSGPVLALELLKRNAVKEWRKLLGPTDSVKARIEEPNSIRALFGTDKTENAAHGSDSIEAAKRVIVARSHSTLNI